MKLPIEWIPVIAAFISGVFGPIIVRFAIRKIESVKDPLNDAFTFGEKVEEKLYHLLEEYSADRIYILQFHNGGHYYPTGKSIQKFSMFYEVVKDPKYSVRNNFQNIPVHLFSKSMKQLSENEFIAIPDYKDPSVATFGLKYIAEESGTKSSYLCTVRNIDDKLIAVLGFDFYKKNAITQDQYIHLQIEAASIGGELAKYLKK